MIALREAKYVDAYRIWLLFSTGESGTVDLADVLDMFPAAHSLKNLEAFKAFALDEWPTLVWPNGFDLSPEMLYERATGKQLVWLHTNEQKSASHASHA